MPNFDTTGPEGKGPMTGKGDGSCNPDAPRGCCRGLGRGLDRGRGRGIGRRASSISIKKEE